MEARMVPDCQSILPRLRLRKDSLSIRLPSCLHRVEQAGHDAVMIPVDPALTPADSIVLQNLLQDAHAPQECSEIKADKPLSKDTETLDTLAALSNPDNRYFQPVVLTSWDSFQVPSVANAYLLRQYINWASNVVRNPSDIVYITHILILFTLGVPNAVFLFMHFNWPQAILQWMLVTYFVGPYSVLTHHHVHGRGVMSPPWAWLDTVFPYILGPLMGQTWNSFYYHHKHHHVEDNGPEDISSTIRYQRDSGLDLALYIGRFVFLGWLELPLYYIRKGSHTRAFKFFAWEIASYAFIILLAKVNFPAAMMALFVPLIQWRVAVMANNWAQHAFVDEDEPTSDFRSSITLIDVVANRHGLNDGYHTSHHLNPLRHWRDHPRAFIAAKEKYAEGRALTFQKVDFIKMAFLLLRKEYDYLAECLVPMGDQIGKSKEELASMLRRKTRRFSEEAIRRKFRNRRP